MTDSAEDRLARRGAARLTPPPELLTRAFPDPPARVPHSALGARLATGLAAAAAAAAPLVAPDGGDALGRGAAGVAHALVDALMEDPR